MGFTQILLFPACTLGLLRFHKARGPDRASVTNNYLMVSAVIFRVYAVTFTKS